MRHFAVLLALFLLAACEQPPNVVICVNAPSDGGGGSGGATGGAGGQADSPCEQPLFAGTALCFAPDPECCALQGADLAKHCFAATAGTRPVPVACTVVPPLPASDATDGRSCMLVATPAPLDCQWGASQMLCCES